MKFTIIILILMFSVLSFSTELWIRLSDPSDSSPIYVNGGYVKIISSDTIKFKNIAPGTYTISMFSQLNTEDASKDKDYANLYFAINPSYANLFGIVGAQTQEKIVQAGTFKIFLAEGDRKIVTINNRAVKKLITKRKDNYACLLVGLIGLLIISIIGWISAS